MDHFSENETQSDSFLTLAGTSVSGLTQPYKTAGVRTIELNLTKIDEN
jgi:hypothetical protein